MNASDNPSENPNSDPQTAHDADSPSAEEGQVAESENKPTLESLQTELADAEKRILMCQADLENFRRRTRRDLQDQLRYAPMVMMNEMLESADNLDRAVEAYGNDPNGDGLVEGVKMVAQQISSSLANHGCKKIEAVGHPFDPSLHQALKMQPSNEFAANTVMQDLRPGFQLHERVLRPSQVFVSTGPEK